MFSSLFSGSAFELDDVGAEFDTGRLLEYSLLKKHNVSALIEESDFQRQAHKPDY